MTKLLERTEPKLVLKHCEELGLEPKVLALCLAVNPKTIQRWHDGAATPNEICFRLLEKLETVYQMAVRQLKKNHLKSWFHSPNHTLGEERPVDLLSRGELDLIRNVLGMLEWGIYS